VLVNNKPVKNDVLPAHKPVIQSTTVQLPGAYNMQAPRTRCVTTWRGINGITPPNPGRRASQVCHTAKAPQHKLPAVIIEITGVLFHASCTPPCCKGTMIMIEAAKQRARPSQSTRMSGRSTVLFVWVSSLGKMKLISKMTRDPLGTL
jgi:hypothetical protein